MKKQPGYILIVTLLMIASMMAIGTYIYLRSTVFIPFMRTVFDREKAKMLALGGLQMGIRQLSQFDPPETEQPTTPGQAQKKEAGGPAQLFARLMPLINRWQTVTLQKNSDGIDGSISICLVCEEGKININRIYDFDKGAFRGQGQAKGDWQKIMGLLCKEIEQMLAGKDLFSALESYLKDRKYPLYDITELLTSKEFEIFRDHIFYKPASPKESDKPTIYLTDIFTTFSNKNTLEPRLFSHSIASILKLASTVTQEKRTEQTKAVGKNFKPTAQWPADWETQLKPFYEKDIQTLPAGVDSLLSTQFNPEYFSIFAYGTVGSITQRLLAVVKRNKRASKGETRYDIAIKRIYWL
jgi:hypothetical protein